MKEEWGGVSNVFFGLEVLEVVFQYGLGFRELRGQVCFQFIFGDFSFGGLKGVWEFVFNKFIYDVDVGVFQIIF